MQEKILPDGRRHLIYSYRGPNGPSNVKATLPRDIRIADIIKAKAELVERAEKRSLKSQVAAFEDAVDIVLKSNGGAGQEWIYRRVRSELAGPMDGSFPERYARYIDKLEDEKKTVNTIANHKAVIQRVLNTAWKRSMIDNLPVRNFNIKRSFRDRVLTIDERQRLENIMLRCGSHLYWSILFAERRPIRSHSDLWQLARENLIFFGNGAPYIKFDQEKTNLYTILPLADMPDMVEYFRSILPAESPYLFPRIDATGWHHMGDPRSHFATLLRQAGINDFHFHDFKRIATTHMIDNGYSADELIDLGIYASRDMIDRCYKKRDAMTVLRRVSVVPDVVHRFGKLVHEQ